MTDITPEKVIVDGIDTKFTLNGDTVVLDKRYSITHKILIG